MHSGWLVYLALPSGVFFFFFIITHLQSICSNKKILRTRLSSVADTASWPPKLFPCLPGQTARLHFPILCDPTWSPDTSQWSMSGSDVSPSQAWPIKISSARRPITLFLSSTTSLMPSGEDRQKHQVERICITETARRKTACRRTSRERE